MAASKSPITPDLRCTHVPPWQKNARRGSSYATPNNSKGGHLLSSQGPIKDPQVATVSQAALGLTYRNDVLLLHGVPLLSIRVLYTSIVWGPLSAKEPSIAAS